MSNTDVQPTSIRTIGMVADDFMPAMTGVGVHVQDLSRALVRRGHRVFVLTTRRKGEPVEEVWEGVQIYRLPTLRVYGFDQALPSRRLLREILLKESPDVMHHHYIGFLMQGVHAVSRRLSIPEVSTFHFSPDILTQALLLRPFRSMIGRQLVSLSNKFRMIIAPSLSLVGELKKMGIKTPIRHVPNWVTFSDQDIPAAKLVKPIFSVLFVGRVSVEKNLSLLIRAFKDVLDKFPASRLSVVGEGPTRKEAEEECRALGIKDHVTFFGFVDHAEVAAHYLSCDVFVLPSRSEVNPLVALEAMWFGRPLIVTSSIVSASELVEEGKNGYIVSPDSSKELSGRIVTLATNTELRTKMGEEGRRRAEGYRIERVIDSIELVYDKAVVLQ